MILNCRKPFLSIRVNAEEPQFLQTICNLSPLSARHTQTISRSVGSASLPLRKQACILHFFDGLRAGGVMRAELSGRYASVGGAREQNSGSGLPMRARSQLFAENRLQRYNRRSADVAQLVEQLIRNQQVIGSSPIVGSIPFFPVWVFLETICAARKGDAALRPCSMIGADELVRPIPDFVSEMWDPAGRNQIRYQLSTYFLLRG